MPEIYSDVAGTQIVPRGRTEAPILLELKDTREAEYRLSDIAVVNHAILPGLISAFTKGLAELARAMGVISFEKVKAQHRMEQRKSHLLIYEVPKIIEEKKLKTSEDIRTAIINLDPDFAELSQVQDNYEEVFENLKIRFKTIEHALYGCKTITQFKQGLNVGNDDYTGSNAEPGQTSYKS